MTSTREPHVFASAPSDDAVIFSAAAGVRSTTLAPAEALRPTPDTVAVAPGSKDDDAADDDAEDTLDVEASTMSAAHAASEAHAAVYCLDMTRTDTGPVGAGTGCLGDI